MTARKRDGSYSCWTLWNEATKSLNRGHYELLGEEEGANILRSYFNDITDEPENYGMEKTKVVVKASVDESISATVSDNIILLNGHRGR